jgi:Fis family transcriptional regulator
MTFSPRMPPTGVEEREVDESQARQPLRECVRDALENYFSQLGGHPPGDLYRLVMTEVEAPLLVTVMRYTRGNQSKAAEVLGINRGTLRKKLREHGID